MGEDFAMPLDTELLTPRLTLRQWQQSDLEPFALLNSDADVMRYYPAPWSREQSHAFAQQVMRVIDERGWGFWAVEEKESAGTLKSWAVIERLAYNTPANLTALIRCPSNLDCVGMCYIA